MALEAKRPTMSNSRRGFYVRMKLLHKHAGPQQQEKKKNLCFRYYKCLLWFSLSLYFFSSYFITHKPIPLSRTQDSKSKTVVSRTLFESSNSTLNQQNKNVNRGLLKDLKVYIYELPSKYNTDWLANERCSNHLFASEVAIHKALSNSLDCISFPLTIHLWNRSQGSDHVFVASHDYGACFHAMEERAAEDGIPEFLKRSIILQTFGVKFDHPCQDVENVVIPPFISPESVQTTLEKYPLTGRRDIWAFFRGKMEVHPKNISGRYYSKKVRTVIWRKYSGDPRFYLRRHRFAGYQSEIARSVFCLCPLGWAPWSPRLVESIALGCVPVIIADGIRLPFPTAVRWSDISLTVAEKDVSDLGTLLDDVAASNLSAIQKNLWAPDVRRALLFNDRVQEGDATWHVLSALAQKLGRSSRTGRLSDQ
ncbi:hypothetical protein OIU76_014546 [Salix suchowensis]|nr:hypothetical protein OIU76_014546 [Salix suchowensis]